MNKKRQSDMDIVDFKPEAPATHRRLSDLPERVVAGDPHHATKMRYVSQDGGLKAGTWTSTLGKWRVFADRDEFCFIISGHVELIDEDGIAKTFTTGDSFLTPNGFSGFWNVIETTQKHFVIREYQEDS